MRGRAIPDVPCRPGGRLASSDGLHFLPVILPVITNALTNQFFLRVALDLRPSVRHNNEGRNPSQLSETEVSNMTGRNQPSFRRTVPPDASRQLPAIQGSKSLPWAEAVREPSITEGGKRLPSAEAIRKLPITEGH